MIRSGKFLTKAERQDLIQTLRKQKDKQLAYRINCILCLDQGLSPEEIESLLFISVRSIYRFLHAYQQGGLDRLLHLNYQGRLGKLSQFQEACVCDYLRSNIVTTAKEVVSFIQNRFGISYTAEGIVPLLHRLGFEYKKMRQVPSKADAHKQCEFVEQYQMLRSLMESEEKIYFMDAVHPQHNSKSCYAWILKGQEKQLKTNTGRQRLNINGLYSPQDHEIIFREDDTIDADSTIKLLQALEDRHPELALIYVVRDNARYYLNAAVTAYLQNSTVVMLPLPTYSPNLNLIERLWRFLNKHVIRGKYYEKYGEFREAVLNFLSKGINACLDELDSLMTERFQIIEASGG